MRREMTPDWKSVSVAAACFTTLTILVSIAGGCLSPNNPLPDALLPDGGSTNCDELTWENFARQFFADYCLLCHSETLVSDLARYDAPVGINYDTIEGVREFRKRIRLRAGELGDMPPRLLPVPRPSEEERVRLIQWIDCGTLTDADVASSGG